MAASVFKERGFRGTTLNHIADALGTDRATLYYYVGSKEDLFQEIVREAVGVNLATAISIRDGEGTAPEKVRQLIVSVMASYAEFYPVLYVLIQENLDHVAPERDTWAQEMKQVNHDFTDVLIEIIEAGHQDGTLSSAAPAWLQSYGIMGMVGWTNRWFDPNKAPVSAEEIGSTFADMVLGGLLA